jgi:hypothetical protein
MTLSINDYGFVINKSCNKHVCLSKPLNVTHNKKKAYYVICQFSVHYESVMF